MLEEELNCVAVNVGEEGMGLQDQDMKLWKVKHAEFSTRILCLWGHQICSFSVWMFLRDRCYVLRYIGNFVWKQAIAARILQGSSFSCNLSQTQQTFAPGDRAWMQILSKSFKHKKKLPATKKTPLRKNAHLTMLSTKRSVYWFECSDEMENSSRNFQEYSLHVVKEQFMNCWYYFPFSIYFNFIHMEFVTCSFMEMVLEIQFHFALTFCWKQERQVTTLAIPVQILSAIHYSLDALAIFN
jgi:hypothetical protein